MDSSLDAYLKPTPVFDCDHPSIQAKAASLTRHETDATGKATKLFYFVRDEMEYAFYPPSHPLEDLFRASHTLSVRRGFCIPKAVLLATLARAAGIPAGIAFADIRNHLLPQKAMDLIGGNLIRLHGFAVLHLDGKWVKATPAFDLKMSEDNGLVPVEFDGTTDAMLPSHDVSGRKHIEYVGGLVHRLYVTDLGRYFDDIDPMRLVEALLEGFDDSVPADWMGGLLQGTPPDA
jgi:transglutaminase-like putative cysteine protease